MPRSNHHEDFIIRDLEKKAEATVRSLYNIWKGSQKIDPVFFSWPAVRIQTENGEPHEGICVLEMTMPKEEWTKAMRAMIKRTEAYAVLFIEQGEKEVSAILESSHGAHSWHLPIKNHGGLQILGPITRRSNVENLGLLWRPHGAVA